MKRDLTVYVASAWWRDCDPHTAVVALTVERAERAIEDAIRSSAESANDGADDYCVCGSELRDGEDADEHADCFMDAQAWSGVFPESLRTVLDGMRTSMDGGQRGRYQRRETLTDLRASGVAFLETP